ncbi:MAG: NifU family protein [Bacteroidetes bacterium]|nr:NifU family protein [Bacteroidota bacterium]
METTTIKKPVIVYAESTPNPATMKFVANSLLIADGATAEYLSPASTKGAPIAAKLFQLPFVKSIFINSNYITVTKKDGIAWDDIILELREFIKSYLDSGSAVVTELPKVEVHTDNRFSETKTIYSEHVAPQNETEHKIIEVLEQYIRPAVEQDGGLITFKSFSEGVVTVALKGSCSGCPSSTITLKAGIEGLLKKMVPGVNEVVAEAL